MFAIIINEKGGAERRESFDKNEINVGRVQGNDLMLPKGNVSKHHARLLFRDGRFIVTDLKSTNGTYVNGRKIAQATIVREGDKIYIGDFVLRLEANDAAAQAEEEPTGNGQEESIRTLAREQGNVPGRPPPAPAVTLKAPTHPPGAPLPRPQGQGASHAPPPPLPAPAAPARATEAPQGFAIEHDPDDSAPLQKPRNPSAAPPPLAISAGANARPLTMPLNQMAPPVIGQRSGTTVPPLGAPPQVPPQGSPPPLPGMATALSVQVPPPAASPSVAPPGRATAPPARVPPKETPAQAGRRLALMTLLDRIADAVDLSPLSANPIVPEALAQQIERAARDQANAMREEGDAPEGIDLDVVVRDAQRELIGLGAFEPLFEDEDVGEIHCPRFDQLYTTRGAGIVGESSAFSSEEALRRAIARLAQQSGEPWKAGETIVERRLPRAAFVAIAPPSAMNHVLTIRKRRRVEATLDELVRAGSLSKPMAQLLESCAAARTNMLVSGSTPLALLSALASVGGSAGERVVVVQDVEELGVGSAHAASVSPGDGRAQGEACVRAASKLRADRLVVTHLTSGVAVATLDAISEGSDGVLAALPAPSLRQGISRLVTQLVLYRPGLSLEAAREVALDCFELAIELGTFADGRLRVTRIAELGGADSKGSVVVRDLFVFSPDAGGDGSFSATGVVPRIANELAARGIKLDAAMFKRAGR